MRGRSVAKRQARPLTPERWSDFVDLFERRGPRGGRRNVPAYGCWCMYWRDRSLDHGTPKKRAMGSLVRAGGGFRPAGELSPGDLIGRWEGGERRPARVRAVVPTGRETQVFNLVVGESAVFVAGGFLARGKPPPDAEGTVGGG